MITILIKELNGSITIISKNKVVGGTCRKFKIDKATIIKPIPKIQPIRSVFDFIRNKTTINPYDSDDKIRADLEKMSQIDEKLRNKKIPGPRRIKKIPGRPRI